LTVAVPDSVGAVASPVTHADSAAAAASKAL
jgi:hypothetical protein